MNVKPAILPTKNLLGEEYQFQYVCKSITSLKYFTSDFPHRL